MCKESINKSYEKERFEKLILLIRQALERGEKKILKLCNEIK